MSKPLLARKKLQPNEISDVVSKILSIHAAAFNANAVCNQFSRQFVELSLLIVDVLRRYLIDYHRRYINPTGAETHSGLVYLQGTFDYQCLSSCMPQSAPNTGLAGTALEVIGSYLVSAKFVCGDCFVKPRKLMRELFVRGWHSTPSFVSCLKTLSMQLTHFCAHKTGGGISFKMIITQERLILSALDWTLYGPWNEICNQLDEEEQATTTAASTTATNATTAATTVVTATKPPCEESQSLPNRLQSPCSPTFGPCVPLLEAS
jgi:hypothetical protein